jgi:hypothetical protein
MPSADGNRDVGFPSAGEDTRPPFHRVHSEGFISPPRKRTMTKRPKGTRPVHLHCLWSLVLISDSFYVQRRDEAIKDEAWRFVCLIIRR